MLNTTIYQFTQWFQLSSCHAVATALGFQAGGILFVYLFLKSNLSELIHPDVSYPSKDIFLIQEVAIVLGSKEAKIKLGPPLW